MFEETLEVVAGLATIETIETSPPILDTLFARLADDAAAADAWRIEDEIWEIWTAHPDPALAALMTRAIAAVAFRRWSEAQTLLDDLVRAAPLWAEAWNKRATLLFLRGDDAASARDIRRTLQLEPRHFGALAGFARICLRHDDVPAALVAAEQALRIHPQLMPMRILAEELHRLRPPTVH